MLLISMMTINMKMNFLLWLFLTTVGPALSVPTVTVDAEAPPPMTSMLTRTLKWSKKVGSGTAQGGSSAYCKKNTGYNCGAVFPPNGDTCGHKGCCCRPEDGTGYKMDTCGSAKGYAYRGCNSCWGRGACTRTNNINVGTSSCHDMHSCDSVSDSTIDNVSCHGRTACQGVQNSIIHKGSCQGEKTCYQVTNSIIGEGSCNNGSNSCHYLKNVTVGNNSCNNGEEVCWGCKHNVPDNACNQGSTGDMTDGRCNFCG